MVLPHGSSLPLISLPAIWTASSVMRCLFKSFASFSTKLIALFSFLSCSEYLLAMDLVLCCKNLLFCSFFFLFGCPAAYGVSGPWIRFKSQLQPTP